MAIQDIPILELEIEEKEIELTEIGDNLTLISRVEMLFDIRNRDSETFYSKMPQTMKKEGIDMEAFFNIAKPAIGEEAYSYFVEGFINNPSSLQSNFEQAEIIVKDRKKIYEENKVEYTKELNKLRAELLKSQTENPLTNIPFGKSDEIKNLFKTNPDAIVKKITGVIVESLSDRKNHRRPAKRGDLNFKKTIKHSMGNGGTPYDLHFKNSDIKINKEKPKIYIIMDISGSCASFVPLSATLAFSFAHALREYEIVFYTASSPPPSAQDKLPDNVIAKKYAKELLESTKKWERKDLVGHKGNWEFNRVSTKYLLKNVKNPSVLFNEIRSYEHNGISDYSLSMIDALIPVAPDNSVFIVFTDGGYRHQAALAEMVKGQKFCRLFNHFSKRIFYFNLYENFEESEAETLEHFSYISKYLNPRTNEYQGEDYSSWAKYSGCTEEKLCAKGKIPRTNIYPLDTIHKKPENYDDWLQEVLRLIKEVLI